MILLFLFVAIGEKEEGEGSHDQKYGNGPVLAESVVHNYLVDAAQCQNDSRNYGHAALFHEPTHEKQHAEQGETRSYPKRNMIDIGRMQGGEKNNIYQHQQSHAQQPGG
jgi:hypothetical protein